MKLSNAALAYYVGGYHNADQPNVSCIDRLDTIKEDGVENNSTEFLRNLNLSFKILHNGMPLTN